MGACPLIAAASTATVVLSASTATVFSSTFVTALRSSATRISSTCFRAASSFNLTSSGMEVSPDIATASTATVVATATAATVAATATVASSAFVTALASSAARFSSACFRFASSFSLACSAMEAVLPPDTATVSTAILGSADFIAAMLSPATIFSATCFFKASSSITVRDAMLPSNRFLASGKSRLQRTSKKPGTFGVTLAV
mmetsp:Transcript_70299/g.111526  ORF Transcript_70299/g.111526 Transcript_70299/m.111526 type:complete len:202 (-) Transcript_70299:1149-1754(-)